jgi:hypothetical protein
MAVGEAEVGDLAETLQRGHLEHGHREELDREHLEEARLEDELHGDPLEEAEQRAEGRGEQRGVLRVAQDVVAEREDLREVLLEGHLEEERLLRGHLVARVVEDLLGEQQQDLHVVGADGLGRLGGLDEVGDEGGPVLGPLVLGDLHQHHVKLVDEGLLLAHDLLIARYFQNHVHNKVLNALSLFAGKNVPSGFDTSLKDRQGDDTRSVA